MNQESEKKNIKKEYYPPETQRVLFMIFHVFCLEICLQVSQVFDFLCFIGSVNTLLSLNMYSSENIHDFFVIL